MNCTVCLPAKTTARRFVHRQLSGLLCHAFAAPMSISLRSSLSRRSSSRPLHRDGSIAGSRSRAGHYRVPVRGFPLHPGPGLSRALRMSAAVESGSVQEGLPTMRELKGFLRAKASGGAVRKVFDLVIETEQGTGPYGHLDVDFDAYRMAIRMLVRQTRTDLAFKLYQARMDARRSRPEVLPADVSLAAGVLRSVIRNSRKRKEMEVDSAVLFDDIEREAEVEEEDSVSSGENANAVASVIVALLDLDKIPDSAIGSAVKMGRVLLTISQKNGKEAAIPVAVYNKCIRFFGKKRCLDGVYGVLDAMRACEITMNNETFEFLGNAVVRQVEFVTGAVSMDTLPDPLGVEVAFVGRSNVGKSSLVNMVCNRKALAYVSGRPGKTQQFNYFLLNGGDADGGFYFVDLPGVGFARVSKPVQASWLEFMESYFGGRENLRVVFHLIDGRHGCLAEDELLMKRIARSAFAGQYVIALTKMDKVDKQRAKTSVLDSTRAMLQRSGFANNVPILSTSASSKLGRDEVWRYLQKALYKRY